MPGKKLSDDWTHLSPAVAAAYGVCLDVEKELMRKQTPALTAVETKAVEKRLVNIRILGYLLVFGPTDTAREHVANTILAEKDQGSDTVISRGGFYDQLLLRSFRKVKEHTPQGSRDSPTSFISTLTNAARVVNRQPTNYLEAKKSALVRDNYRCMATGAIDLDCWTKFEELRQPMAGSFQSTECVHIFAESMSVGTEDERKVYTEKAWTIIRKFGYEDVYNELGGPSGVFHRLENVMTLTSTLHVLFDKLKLWFEATDTPNSYKVCSSLPVFYAGSGVPEQVVFATERQDLPLPSPGYLEIHAACCRVAYMSGAMDYYRDLDDDDPFATKLRCFDPVGSDFSAVLQTRLLDLSERGAVVATVSGKAPY